MRDVEFFSNNQTEKEDQHIYIDGIRNMRMKDDGLNGERDHKCVGSRLSI